GAGDTNQVCKCKQAIPPLVHSARKLNKREFLQWLRRLPLPVDQRPRHKVTPVHLLAPLSKESLLRYTTSRRDMRCDSRCPLAQALETDRQDTSSPAGTRCRATNSLTTRTIGPAVS